MEQKQEIAERLKQANNILVTVSASPSVDQLASCIGLTLALTKMGKHAIAVFSGDVPSTIEFLQPDKTIEKTTDSLRDFIISLDKSKADKLRYKVEDKIVKIFITPYRTSLSDKDLEFSQGDFNVEVVVALGVKNQADLDQAITAHGRILHDATVATLNTQPGGELGSMNWVEPKASSLCELVVQLVETIDKSLLDEQMATALLTGIVAETARFSNEKTTPSTMSISSELMSAGANQQLVATKLGEAEKPKPEPVPEPQPEAAPAASSVEAPAGAVPEGEVNLSGAAPSAAPIKPKKESNDGSLEIEHHDEPKAPMLDLNAEGDVTSDEKKEEEKAVMPQINIDDQGSLHNLAYEQQFGDEKPSGAPALSPSTDPNGRIQSAHMILEPPTMGGQLTANTVPEDIAGDPLSLPAPTGAGLLQRSPATAATAPPLSSFPQPASPTPPPPAPPFGTANISSQYEPPAAPAPVPMPAAPPPSTDLSAARDAVSQAMGANPPGAPEPIQALNAQPLGNPLNSTPPAPAGPSVPPASGPATPVVTPPPVAGTPPTGPPPPPVPPPMMPPA